jgi:hypothetical protein
MGWQEFISNRLPLHRLALERRFRSVRQEPCRANRARGNQCLPWQRIATEAPWLPPARWMTFGKFVPLPTCWENSARRSSIQGPGFRRSPVTGRTLLKMRSEARWKRNLPRRFLVKLSETAQGASSAEVGEFFRIEGFPYGFSDEGDEHQQTDQHDEGRGDQPG